ncbi:MAG: DUF4363 family protein [Desulfotomaculum sp.]|nr:DUF4363 family protein [Desulfotomaculum sp.]
MRLLTVLFVIFLLIVMLGAWSNYAISASAEQFSKTIDEIMMDAENNNWEEAKQKVTFLENRWQKDASWWPVVLDHQEIDNIEFSLARVKEYVAQKNTDLSLGHLSELKLMIKHIPEKEAVTIKNIL